MTCSDESIGLRHTKRDSRNTYAGPAQVYVASRLLPQRFRRPVGGAG